MHISSSPKAALTEFTDLLAWQEGHKLALAILKVVSGPQDRVDYGLPERLQSAAIEVTHGMANAFGCRLFNEKIQLLIIANGRLKELQNLLILGRDLAIIPSDSFTTLYSQSETVSKLLFGLTRSLQEKLNQPTSGQVEGATADKVSKVHKDVVTV